MHIRRMLVLMHFITVVQEVLMLFLLLIALVSNHAIIPHKSLGTLIMHILFLLSKGHALSVLRPVA